MARYSKRQAAVICEHHAEKIAIPDMVIETQDYSVRAFGGKFTLLYANRETFDSLVELLDVVEEIYSLRNVLKNMEENGLDIEHIARLCASELEQNGSLQNSSSRCSRSIYYRKDDPSRLLFERRYGLSRSAFSHVMKQCNNMIMEPGVAREELIAGLPGCKTVDDFERVFCFYTLSDNSPVIKYILLKLGVSRNGGGKR